VNANDRAITGVVALAHSLVHTYEFAFPVFATVWLAEFATTEAVIGFVFTVGFLPFGLGAIPAGVLVDRHGSKPFIAACLIGMGSSFLALAILPDVLGGLLGRVTVAGTNVAPEVVGILLAVLLWGIAAGFYHPSGLALISKGVEERGTAFAYHGTAGNVGTAVGPLATTVLLFALGDQWRLVAGLLAAPALIGAALALRVDVNETAAVAADGGSKADPGVDSLGEFLGAARTLFAGAFVAVFVVVMLSGLYYRGVLTFLPELLGGFDAVQPVEAFDREFEPANYIYTGLLACGVAGQYAGGKLTDRVPVELGLAVGYGALGVIALVYLPAADAGLGPLLALSAILGFALFVVQPFYQATVADYTPAEARGLSYGFTYLGVFGVGALGGVVAGTTLTFLGQSALFLVLAGFGAAAGAIGTVLYLRR
jgi:MFS family permease